VLYGDLQSLHYHLVDMHTQYPKIKEDNEFPKVLSAKRNLKTPEIWSTKEIESVATNPPELKPGQAVLPSGPQTLHYNLGDMHNLTPKIRGDTTLQR
jgi:hypothetical protein